MKDCVFCNLIKNGDNNNNEEKDVDVIEKVKIKRRYPL